MISAITAIVAIGLLGQSSDAGMSGYARSRVATGKQNDPKAHCLWWKEGAFIFQQSDRGNTETGGTEFGAVSASFQSWQNIFAECGNLSLAEGPHSSSRLVGRRDEGENENLVLFRTDYCPAKVNSSDSCWKTADCANRYDCWGDDGAHTVDTIALTTTTYDPSNGRIYDADVEFNTTTTIDSTDPRNPQVRHFVFTTVDAPPCDCPIKNPPAGCLNTSCVASDVQNTMTHEAGHVFGLDHYTADPGSTLYPSAPSGEISKRVIDDGSKRFICENYPKGHVSFDCIVDATSKSIGSPASTSSGGCAAVGLGPWLFALIGRVFFKRRKR